MPTQIQSKALCLTNVKTTPKSGQEGSVILRCLYLIGLILGIGCNPRADYALIGSAEIPSAYGDIKIEKIDQKQWLLTLLIDHLPPPERLDPSLQNYVLWIERVNHPPKLKSVLDYDPDSQQGRAMMTTSLKSFALRVTAETSTSPKIPSDYVVTTQFINKDKH